MGVNDLPVAPRAVHSGRPVLRSLRNTAMWQHILTGVTTLILESYMQAIEWIYIG
jgi:hypothetical protein